MQYVAQQITSFTETNLTDIYDDWSATTTYIYESGTPTNSSVVRYGTYYYRSLVDSNLNKNPKDYEDIYWVKYGISNKFAMLDLSAQSKSEKIGGSLTVTFEQGTIRTLGIGNYTAYNITIKILDSDGTTELWVSNTDITFCDHIVDWYTYTQSEDIGIDYTNKTTKVDLPLTGTYVRVTFNASVAMVDTACGFLVGGTAVDMGETLQDINFSFNSFALKEIDEWGSLTVVKRAVQDLIDFETSIDTSDMVRFKRRIKNVYNDIVMFIVDESENSVHENLLILGIIQEAGVLLTQFDKTIMTFSVMESI